MWPDRISNLGLLTYESGVLPTELRGPAMSSLDKEVLQTWGLGANSFL